MGNINFGVKVAKLKQPRRFSHRLSKLGKACIFVHMHKHFS